VFSLKSSIKMVYDRFKFGATAWAIGFPGNAGEFREIAQQVRDLPFHSDGRKASVIELLCLMGEEGHEANLKLGQEYRGVADELDMEIRVCGFNPEVQSNDVPPHLSSTDDGLREIAVARVKRGIDYAAAVANTGKGVLNGPWHMTHKHFKMPYPGELNYLADVIKSEIDPYAREKRVRLALEPLKPDEGYIPFPGDDAIKLTERVDSPFFGLNGDTVHLLHARGTLIENIETLARSGYLVHFHLSEPNRLQWGTGDIGIRTPEILEALDRGGYEGPVTLENFCEGLNEGLHLWSPDEGAPLEVLQNGAAYVRDSAKL